MNKTRHDFNGAYKIENLKFNGLICKTNVPSNTAFRSFGSPEGLLIMEDIIFNIACTLGMSQEKVIQIFYLQPFQHLCIKYERFIRRQSIVVNSVLITMFPQVVQRNVSTVAHTRNRSPSFVFTSVIFSVSQSCPTSIPVKLMCIQARQGPR